MGANNLLIMPGSASSGGVAFGAGSVMTLTAGDANVIADECRPAVARVAPVVRSRTQVVFGNKNWVPVYIYGTTPELLDVRDWPLDRGRNFTHQEVAGAADVCLIGQTIARELFGRRPALGRVLRVNNYPLKVIGTLSVKGANMMGMDQDDIVLAPWRTIKFKVSGSSAQTANASATLKADSAVQVSSSGQRFPIQTLGLYPVQSPSQVLNNPPPLLTPNIDQIFVKVASARQIPEAIKEISAVLRERHHLHAGQINDFNIRDMTEVGNVMGSASRLMSGLLLAVALISLLVGGVGIMNIMLVSVTERTKEIGLRMAVGARARHILTQFLAEAVLLCVLGGLLGVGLGFLSSWLVRTLLHWPTEPSMLAVIAAVVVSALVGITFGFYPAYKASRLDPIEALRYE
jgi:ABC-type antimicrobial peptide transport system permease subunit